MRRKAAFLATTAAALFALFALAGATARAETLKKGPWVQRVTQTSAVVRIELDPPASATLTLGLGGPNEDAAANRIFESNEARAFHSIVVTGLEPAKRYNYRVSVAGASPTYAAFTTAPRDDSNAPFKFLIYGDNRTDDAAHAAVVRAMQSATSDFIVHTGDFVDNGGSASQWQTFFDIEAPLLRDRSVFSCVGNHELTDGQGAAYIKYFAPVDPPAVLFGADARAPLVPPEHLNGTFRWSNARFFLLNGMVGWQSGADRAWFDKALAESDNEAGLVWRIVVVHFGPWSSGPHGGNRHLHEAQIPSLLRTHKIDLVIAGHDHIYERGWAEGLAYLVSGGGGAPMYKIKDAAPSAKKFESARHFIEASVNPAAMQFTAKRVDGTQIERCGLRKGTEWECESSIALAASRAGSSPAGSGSAASDKNASATTPASKCGCRVVGAEERGGSTIALPAGGLAAAALAILFVRRRRRAILGACRVVTQRRAEPRKRLPGAPALAALL